MMFFDVVDFVVIGIVIVFEIGVVIVVEIGVVWFFSVVEFFVFMDGDMVLLCVEDGVD